jgi:hypothetical protein
MPTVANLANTYKGGSSSFSSFFISLLLHSFFSKMKEKLKGMGA